jgi:uncharacterized C2H2 Zn-finger protein
MASEQFICQACGAGFASRRDLDQHNKEAHAPAEHARWGIAQQALGGLKCPTCGVEFTTRDQLEQHARQEHQGAC